MWVSNMQRVGGFLATVGWFSLGSPVSSTNKTLHRHLTEIFLKSGVKHHNPTQIRNGNFQMCI